MGDATWTLKRLRKFKERPLIWQVGWYWHDGKFNCVEELEQVGKAWDWIRRRKIEGLNHG